MDLEAGIQLLDPLMSYQNALSRTSSDRTMREWNMARLIVLRFENDDDAEDFVGRVNRTSSVNFDFYDCPTVEGMFQTPTKFHGGHGQSSGWRKSDKHGWWICRDCGAPSVGWSSNIRAVISDANDLLEKPSKNTQERIDMTPDFDNETGDPMEQDDGVNI
jgi:hypothetical protein